MKHRLSYTLGLIALGVVGFAASPAGADTVAAGPYYATPSWDQTLPTSTRFIVLSNMNSDAVLDRETGLVWQKSPFTGTRSWFVAHTLCRASAVGGRKGWRLPTAEELMSLVDPTQSNPALPVGNPFAIQNADYWSANTLAGNSDNAWYVRFTDGIPLNQIKSTNIFLWCVRGGQGVDPQ
jgi:hypothetical protein